MRDFETEGNRFRGFPEALSMKPLFIRVPNPFPTLAFVLITGAYATTHALPAHADAAAGKTDFAACAACHSVNGSDGVGPHLNGVIGRKAGTVAGFNYSNAVKRSNIVWNATTLDSYIANPQKAIPGNHMPYSGLPDVTARADIVAYLTTLH
jgi:cytochrome c